MNVDRRLHHAARELREVPIVPPDMSPPPPSRPGLAARAMTVVAPTVRVAVGLFAGVVMLGAQDAGAPPQPEAAVAASGQAPRAAGPARAEVLSTPPAAEQLSGVEEVLLIRSFRPPTRPPTTVAPTNAF